MQCSAAQRSAVQCSGHFIKYIEFEVVFYVFLLNLLEPLENP
jgi:hypothetical protein